MPHSTNEAPDTPAAPLSAEEEQLLVRQWNATARPFPLSACVHHLIEAQVARTPQAIALVFRDRQLSFAQLDADAEALAARMRGAGAARGALIAISLPRSLEQVIAVLAVLKAGGAYVPLDPLHPPDRLRWMLEDSGAALVMVSVETEPIFQSPGARLTRLLRVEGPPHELAPRAMTTAPSVSSDLAYVLYTSGSTGKPKGVEVTHRNVVNFFSGMDAVIGPEPGVWLAVTSIGFDISVLELLWTLSRGFRVIVQEEGQLAATTASIYSMPQQMKRHGVTHLQCTPSLASMLVRDAASNAALAPLRALLVGGEALAPDLARKLTGATAGQVLNMYGPTETTIWSATHRLDPNDERVYIGRPIANTQLYVVDPERRLLPVGAEGELYIGGEGVARGYRHRPELTAERFVPSPFSADPDDRLYRTGDIVRYDSEGRLEFIGRLDQQVKIRGVRIELEEIELALREHPAVAEAVVVVREGHADDKRLIAYVVPSRADATAADLSAFLTAKLPPAMIPAAFVTLTELPRTPGGKTDRLALPEVTPEAMGGALTEHIAPATDLERTIATMWADVLGIDDVSVTDRFFDLGGHSLLVVDVQTRLQESLGRHIELVDLFRYPTVRALAEHLTSDVASDGATASGIARGQLRQQSIARRSASRRPTDETL